MKTRILSLLVVLCLVAGLFPAVMAAEVASGPCGENLTWVLTEDGTLTISGMGEMPNYSSAGNKPAPWLGYSDRIKAAVVENGVTRLGNCAFEQLPLLASVTLPQTLTNIGTYAFENCQSLAHIELPDTVTRIGNNAFYGCTKLQEIDIPSGIETIEYYTFRKCTGLTQVVLPDGLKEICSGAFMECTQLKDITLPASLEILGETAFGMCQALERVCVPEGVTILPARVFASCYTLREVSLPDSLLVIGEWAFRGNNALTSLTIPSGVTMVGSSAFWDCEMEYLIFTGSAPDIAADAFTQGKATVYYPAEDPSWTDDVMQQYGGKLTWIGYEGEFHIHEYTAVVTEPTCTEQGYTTHSCPVCGDSYVDSHTDALGHDWKDYHCIRCGQLNDHPFTDVPTSEWYYAPVLWAVEKGITSGATETTFNPNGDCLRAQVVTFLWRAAGQPEPATTVNPFVDVKPSDFYYDAVLWAVENGITNGADATHFNPMGVCNRAQVVTFLHRAFEAPAVENAVNPFTDVPAGAWYTAPVLWAVENGITNGLSATQFGPNTNCNRAQIVTFLYRAYTE